MSVLAVLTLCAAQARASDGLRVYDEQLRVRMEQQAPQAQRVGFDYGGWFDVGFFRFQDNTDINRGLMRYSVRPWGRLDVQGVHTAYVRGLFEINDWNGGDRPPYEAQTDSLVTALDRAWYQFDFGRLMQLHNDGRKPAAGLKVKVGREYAKLGTGLVLATPLDMVQFDAYIGPWELRALLGRSPNQTNNIDRSPSVADHERRCFWGAQVTYTGLDDHRPFAYFLSQTDHTPESPRDPVQEYGYDSSYVGVGSTGNLWLRDLRYQVEVVGEFGETYSQFQTRRKDDICAMAVDGLLEYFFRTRMSPRVMVEYIYGSGDEDRTSSVSSTVGGNLAGTRDNAFNAFGFRDTGIAFAPRIGNLHTYVLGGSVMPLENFEIFRKLEVGSKVFFYQKAASEGAISDTAATGDASWVGWEWDAFVNWRITSDVSWTLRYGAFQPGSAFDGADCRQFLYSGVTYSF
jgi:hypothetical protein